MTLEPFVAGRRTLWLRLAALCDQLQERGAAGLTGAELREFGRLYRLAASDLSYAAAHLRHPELLAWLNRLVARAHGLLYVRPRPRRGSLRRFLADYPRRWRAAGRFLLLAAVLLGGSLVTAWALVAGDPRLARLFVPVEMTAEVLTEPGGGIPVAAFVALSGYLLTANLTAAFVAFATGVVFGLGAVAALVRNGLLIGALGGVATAAGGDSLLQFAALLAPHGVLELAALVTSAAAGLQLGHALLAGGRQPRLVALQHAAREAVALLAGCLPWFVIAAVIEGLLTPLPAPPAIKLGAGLLTGGALAWYLASGAKEPEARR